MHLNSARDGQVHNIVVLLVNFQSF